MKKFLVAMGVAAFAFVGCGDDSSSSSGPNDESGVESSSSSNTQSEAKQSSSSEKTGRSSSSVNDASSSSVKPESSENSSSSSKVPAYSDAPRGKWYATPAAWAHENAVEPGQNGLFAPHTPCTRASTILYIYKAFEGSSPSGCTL